MRLRGFIFYPKWMDGWMTCYFTYFAFQQYFSHIKMMGG